MKQKSLISQLAKIHNGTITHRELALNGVSSYSISKAVQDGTLEKIRPGIYLVMIPRIYFIVCNKNIKKESIL